MQNPFILTLSDPGADLLNVGGKGASLSKLARAGMPVPAGFHVTTKAYHRFVEQNRLNPAIQAALSGIDVQRPETLEAASGKIRDLFLKAAIPLDIEASIKEALETLRAGLSRPECPLAVRSSATAEDLPEASFAGQQETYLNLRAEQAILDAVRQCWASLWTARAIGYREKQGVGMEGLALAVIVQVLVPAESAGILFTANPVSGRRDQILINASWGLGEAIVSGAVTPDSIVVEKWAFKVADRKTQVKTVRTLQTDNGVTEALVPKELQGARVLDDSQAADLARYGVEIEELYGMPMDIEWAFAGGRFEILQARPITVLPEPPLEWVPPNPKGIYMRGSVVDLMPDPVSPLFSSWGIETLKEQMKPLGKRLTRIEPNMADDYFTTINQYAYMNAAIPGKTWKWILFGLLPSYPRIFRTLVPLWRDEFHMEYKAYVRGIKHLEPRDMASEELLQRAQEIMDAVMYYVCGLMFATMGAAAGSEGLLTRVYDRVAKREGDPPATALLMGWDNIPVQSLKSLFSLAAWIREQPELAGSLAAEPTGAILSAVKSGQPPEGAGLLAWQEFCERFNEHLDRFGHMIFQLDFAEPLPREHPEPMIEMVKIFLRGEGSDPYAQQQQGEHLRLETARMMHQRLKGFKRWAFTKALNWGQSMAEVREDALAEIGLGYPMLRAVLLEMGGRLASAGAIPKAEDIFWLEREEVARLVPLLEGEKPVEDQSGKVQARKAFHRRARASDAPPMMPEKKRIMGIKTDVFVPHGAGGQSADMLKGAPTSSGVVTAPARVLHGPADFGSMQPGEVLIAGTTTPAWTPLFAMASAVVTDIGGPLSHGSIVAREFGIPAVMGTGVATRRIRDGQMIVVDGNAGTVKMM